MCSCQLGLHWLVMGNVVLLLSCHLSSSGSQMMLFLLDSDPAKKAVVDMLNVSS
jgi:hypothetical protein